MFDVFFASPATRLRGQIQVPGDKSISHRSIMFGSIAKGVTQVTGFLEGADALSTMNAFRAMGVQIDGPVDGKVRIEGKGMRGLIDPATQIDCGNSGTTMRLLSGLLSGAQLNARLVGDVSLSNRPMKRVTIPLGLMGAQIATAEGKPPLALSKSKQLHGIDYTLPMASAQVKSAVLLAGLYASSTTRVTEPEPTRDHTERMLTAFGWHTSRVGNTISVEPCSELRGTQIDVPADISSSAFFLVAASIAQDADITLLNVGMNPTRIGIVKILQLMGADLQVFNQRVAGGEPVADLRVRSAQLKGIQVPPELVPLAIDEFPVLFVAACCAQGRTVVTGAEELRVKESDRIQVMADGLAALGVQAQPTPDGMIIEGAGASGAVFNAGHVQSHHDHRISMSFAVASLRAKGPITINGTQNVATSFPNFVQLANQIGMNIATHA
jgi:3-phosphoshikimate 1-carboxyvinyltransferase